MEPSAKKYGSNETRGQVLTRYTSKSVSHDYVAGRAGTYSLSNESTGTMSIMYYLAQNN